MAKKINIIGAGMTGLCAGIYLQKNGFDTEIFELHSQPGGLCTAWERKGYTFNGCIHWLVGSKKGDIWNRFWQEVMDINKLTFLDPEVYFRMEDKERNVLTIYTNLEKLEEELLEKAPEDADEIRRFVKDIEKLSHFEMVTEKAPELFSFMDKIKFIFKLFPMMGLLNKYGKQSHEDYSRKFKNPLLSRAIREMFLPEMAIVFSMISLGWMHHKNAGYPIGASLKFSRLVEEKYLSLGGKISYKAKVDKIITENGKASGIVLEDGTRHEADIVISAADGHYTLYHMLEGKYLSKEHEDLYLNHKTFSSLIQVSLGIRKEFNEYSGTIGFPLESPMQIDPETSTDIISYIFYSYDKTLSPDDCSNVVTIIGTENYQYWQDLRNNDPVKYKSEKERVANAVIDAFEKRFGPVRDVIDVVDVATPATYIRYTNNWKGSFEGWLLTPKLGFRQIKKTVPGLDNFYMIGQWVEPGGGLPGSLMSARNVTQVICRKEGKNFVS